MAVSELERTAWPSPSYGGTGVPRRSPRSPSRVPQLSRHAVGIGRSVKKLLNLPCRDGLPCLGARGGGKPRFPRARGCPELGNRTGRDSCSRQRRILKYLSYRDNKGRGLWAPQDGNRRNCSSSPRGLLSPEKTLRLPVRCCSGPGRKRCSKRLGDPYPFLFSVPGSKFQEGVLAQGPLITCSGRAGVLRPGTAASGPENRSTRHAPKPQRRTAADAPTTPDSPPRNLPPNARRQTLCSATAHSGSRAQADASWPPWRRPRAPRRWKTRSGSGYVIPGPPVTCPVPPAPEPESRPRPPAAARPHVSETPFLANRGTPSSSRGSSRRR